MPDLSSRGIFLSYRRQDTAPYARLLQRELTERFPDARVFMDVDSIEAGLAFAEVIREAVDSCAVLVALIGRQWATLADEQDRRRLDDPHDFVRFEIQAALERGVRVIPVLVDGARPLRQEQLPAELRLLATLNALELSYGRYDYDADRLLDLIQRVLAAASGTGPVREFSSTTNADVLAVSRASAEQRTEALPLPPVSPTETAIDRTKEGDGFRQQQRYVDAETAHREAIRLDPGNGQYHDNLGDALSGQEKYPEAEAAYREAVRLDPDNAIYRNHLGVALFNLKK